MRKFILGTSDNSNRGYVVRQENPLDPNWLCLSLDGLSWEVRQNDLPLEGLELRPNLLAGNVRHVQDDSRSRQISVSQAC
jgi:hypothetical protein